MNNNNNNNLPIQQILKEQEEPLPQLEERTTPITSNVINDDQNMLMSESIVAVSASFSHNEKDLHMDDQQGREEDPYSGQISEDQQQGSTRPSSSIEMAAKQQEQSPSPLPPAENVQTEDDEKLPRTRPSSTLASLETLDLSNQSDTMRRESQICTSTADIVEINGNGDNENHHDDNDIIEIAKLNTEPKETAEPKNKRKSSEVAKEYPNPRPKSVQPVNSASITFTIPRPKLVASAPPLKEPERTEEHDEDELTDLDSLDLEASTEDDNAADADNAERQKEWNAKKYKIFKQIKIAGKPTKNVKCMKCGHILSKNSKICIKKHYEEHLLAKPGELSIYDIDPTTKKRFYEPHKRPGCTEVYCLSQVTQIGERICNIENKLLLLEELFGELVQRESSSTPNSVEVNGFPTTSTPLNMNNSIANINSAPTQYQQYLPTYSANSYSMMAPVPRYTGPGASHLYNPKSSTAQKAAKANISKQYTAAVPANSTTSLYPNQPSSSAATAVQRGIPKKMAEAAAAAKRKSTQIQSQPQQINKNPVPIPYKPLEGNIRVYFLTEKSRTPNHCAVCFAQFADPIPPGSTQTRTNFCPIPSSHLNRHLAKPSEAYLCHICSLAGPAYRIFFLSLPAVVQHLLNQHGISNHTQTRDMCVKAHHSDEKSMPILRDFVLDQLGLRGIWSYNGGAMFDKSMVLADDCSSNSSSSSVQVQPNVTEVTERITRRKRKRKFSRNTDSPTFNLNGDCLDRLLECDQPCSLADRYQKLKEICRTPENHLIVNISQYAIPEKGFKLANLVAALADDLYIDAINKKAHTAPIATTSAANTNTLRVNIPPLTRKRNRRSTERTTDEEDSSNHNLDMEVNEDNSSSDYEGKDDDSVQSDNSTESDYKPEPTIRKTNVKAKNNMKKPNNDGAEQQRNAPKSDVSQTTATAPMYSHKSIGDQQSSSSTGSQYFYRILTQTGPSSSSISERIVVSLPNQPKPTSSSPMPELIPSDHAGISSSPDVQPKPAQITPSSALMRQFGYVASRGIYGNDGNGPSTSNNGKHQGVGDAHEDNNH